MKRQVCFIILLLTNSISFAQDNQGRALRIIYNLPDANLPANTICGMPKYCDCGGSPGILYKFADRPFSPDVSDISTPKTIAASILGQAVAADKNNGYSEFPLPCPGVKFDTTKVIASGKYGTAGREFEYTREAKANVNIELAIKANITELLNSVQLQQSFIDSLKAELEAAYKKVRDKSLKVTATYYELSVPLSVKQDILASTLYSECRAYLKANKKAIITDISLIKYTISYNIGDLTKWSAGIDVQLERTGLKAKLAASIQKEINKTLKATTQNGYQIIGWRKMPV